MVQVQKTSVIIPETLNVEVFVTQDGLPSQINKHNW